MNPNIALNTQSSCADSHEPQSLSFTNALQRILVQLPHISMTESVSLPQALGRVLANALISPLNVPNHENAAMDGYALAAEDLPSTGIQTLQIVGNALAGQAFTGTVWRGQCVRIMTGAMLPEGTDTVIMQERVEAHSGFIRFAVGEKPKQNVRHAGEDIAVNQKIMEAGKRLSPAELGLMASLGLLAVPVKRRLRVAFFSTGNELRAVGERLTAGQIYDSNRYTLYGMLQRLGVDIFDMGHVADDPIALQQTVKTAATHADVIISSGGVSVGEVDFTKQVLGEVGILDFWSVAMKPGRPLAFGKIQDCIFFGLPGNPVAVMVSFYQFVQPAIYKMMGCVYEAVLIPARSLGGFHKKCGRTEFLRGIAHNIAGEWQVEALKEQGSGMLRSMSEANCFIVLPDTQGTVQQGDWVEIQLFSGLV